MIGDVESVVLRCKSEKAEQFEYFDCVLPPLLLMTDRIDGQFLIRRFTANRNIRRIIHLRKWSKRFSIMKVLR